MPNKSNIIFRFFLLCVSAASLSGCQATPIEPFNHAQDTAQLQAKERRLWDKAEAFDEYLLDTDRIYPDPELTAYVQSVMNRLFPEYETIVRVRILNSPSLNAFALPNGSIYINAGLLSRLENEAQLATVLAHEATHFTHKHGWRQMSNVKAKSAAASFLSLGIPILPALAAVTSIYGFSRDLEREADAVGMERLEAAGYDVREAPETFMILKKEVETLDIDEPYFFSSHPKLTDRIESFNALVGARAPGGALATSAYQTKTARLHEKVLQAYLSMGRYQSVIAIFENEDAVDRYPSHATFFLGEACRLRNEKDDLKNAEQAYLDAIRHAPDFAKSYRALGVLYYKQKKANRASEYLQEYLTLEPDASDRGYIEQYLKALEK